MAHGSRPLQHHSGHLLHSNLVSTLQACKLSACCIVPDKKADSSINMPHNGS